MITLSRICISIVCLISLLLSACSNIQKDGPPQEYVDVNKIPNVVPKYEPESKFGNPHIYYANGKHYHVLTSLDGYSRKGIASWYGRKFHGNFTSTHERYNMFAITAASPTLPIPCYVRVTNLENNRSLIVRVNDRGPFANNRIIDLSWAAAKKLGYVNKGTAHVKVTAIDMDPHPTKIVLNHRPHLYLQIGAFAQLTRAEYLKSKIHQFTRRPIRITVGYNNHHQSIYRVQIGPFLGAREFDKLHHILKTKGYGTPVTVMS